LDGSSPLVIDGMNVIGARPDGWWRDRDGAVRRLTHRLESVEWEGPVTAVFDGRAVEGLPEGRHGRIAVFYARRPGPDGADDRIVELIQQGQAGTVVVTSDRLLRRRVSAAGAEVRGPAWLETRLGGVAGPPSGYARGDEDAR
jgi:predicted RNA-binding protein with PIN domain